MPPCSKAGIGCRKQGQPGHRESSAVAAVGAPAAPRRGTPQRVLAVWRGAETGGASGACAKRGDRPRVALVIGNGSYAHVKALPNPSNDARAIAKSLRDIGFTVTEGIDLDRAAMQTMTREFLREACGRRSRWSITPATACRSTAATIWCRSISSFRAGTDVTAAMMDMDTIIAGLDDQVRTNILILDACRNNPMAPKVASTGTSRGIEGGIEAGSGLAAPTSLGTGRHWARVR